MIITIAITSILVITSFVWFANKMLPFSVCPICAGVAGTWLWILAGIYAGLLKVENWQLTAAILMGGTVVGIAYRIEKQLPEYRSPLLWKMLFIPAGFILAYGILTQRWNVALVFFALLLLFAFVFLSQRGKTKNNNETIEELKEKMKDCC